MTPTHCPTCRRPVAFYVDRIGYVHAYCPEAERLGQMALGACQPVVYAVPLKDSREQVEMVLPKPTVKARRLRQPRHTGTHPQRARKTPGLPPPPTREQRMEGLRRYSLRKYGRAAA
jgi:hypothetical protein